MPKTPRLREWRERAALSQGELAARSGTSRATIADLEAGNRGAQPKTVRRLAEALEIEPEELYGEAYPKEVAPPVLQRSFNGLLEEERREALVRSCVEYALSRAERWNAWLAEGDRELLGEMVLEYDSLARFLINDVLQTTRGLGDVGVSLGTEVMRALDRLSRTMRQALGTIEQTDAESARRARAYLERWSA